MIESKRIGGVKEVVSLGPSHFNIPHEERDEILKRIETKINEDMDTNQFIENESIELARKFVLPRSNL